MNNHPIEIYEPKTRDVFPFKDLKDKQEEECKYIGLCNQGNTCYLNSLLQTLFMTPSLRRNLFNWQFDASQHGSKADSIPYQLKALFSRLQLKTQRAESTASLTKSFQWNSNEVYYQQDIQELTRILFNAIEDSMSPLEAKEFSHLFKGTFNQVIKCLKCNQERTRLENFLDINLPVRNDWEGVKNSSLEMALLHFLRHERLDGDNKLSCDNCGEKTDSLKFCRIEQLPRVLTVQINRFDYDFTIDARRKILDKFTFPLELDQSTLKSSFDQVNAKFDSKTLEELAERQLKQQQLNSESYHLYAVVVHSGTATSGHYLAYIKDIFTEEWFEFNDFAVRKVDVTELNVLFGGDINKSSKVGYVLYYIKRAEEAETPDSLIEDSVLAEIKVENEIRAKEEAERLEKLSNIAVKFQIFGSFQTIKMKKDNTILALKKAIKNAFSLETSLDDFRIRSVHSGNGKFLDVIDDEEQTLEFYGITNYKNYSIETKETGGEFKVINPDLITVELIKWEDSMKSLDLKEIKGEKVELNRKMTLSDLKADLMIRLKWENFHCFRVNDDNEPFDIFREIDYLSKELYFLYISDRTRLFVEPEKGQIEAYFKENCCRVKVKFNSPLDKAKFKRITIGSYKFSNLIEVSPKTRLSEVKQQISEIVNLSPDQFLIKKNSHNGTEIKDLAEELSSVSSKAINLYLEVGTPKKASDILVSLSSCQTDYSHFSIFPYKTAEVGLHLVDSNMEIKDITAVLVDSLPELAGFKGKNVFLREFFGEKPGKLLQNSRKLFSYGFREKKKLMLHQCDCDLEGKEDSVTVCLRRFYPSKWCLGDLTEIEVNPRKEVIQILKGVNRYFPEIEVFF